jgi:hypothetical protein
MPIWFLGMQNFITENSEKLEGSSYNTLKIYVQLSYSVLQCLTYDVTGWRRTLFQIV